MREKQVSTDAKVFILWNDNVNIVETERASFPEAVKLFRNFGLQSFRSLISKLNTSKSKMSIHKL